MTTITRPRAASSDITLTDLFCGAGGSSTGAISVPGVRIRMAANHWQLAVDTHNRNHPEADHSCADITQVDPRYFPRTTILWASPSCTNHSQAKGKKRDTLQGDLFEEKLPDEAAERSRATMWDVVRFAEHHRYEAVIVENVVDAYHWLPFQAWLMAMHSIGYEHQLVFLNSMHAQQGGLPAPQSRDRMYVVFHKRGNKAPDVRGWTRPKAWCPTCQEVVLAIQAWKKPDTPVGRYKTQYQFRCPNATCRHQVVEPGWLPASSIIDWTLPGQRIGDRAKPLADKTRARIAAGIARYWKPIHLEAAGQTYDSTSPQHPSHGDPNGYVRAWPVDEPLKTMHATASKALAVPVEGRVGKDARPMTGALRTQTARNETGVVMEPLVMRHYTPRGDLGQMSVPVHRPMPTQTTFNSPGLVQAPFIAELRGGSSDARPTADPLATVVASGNHHGLVVPAGGTWNNDARPLDEPLRTRTTTESDALVVPYYGNSTPASAASALPTVTTVDRHALVVPLRTHGVASPTSEPTKTMVAGNVGQALVMRNNSGGAEMVTPADEPVRTMTTAGHQSILTPGDIDAAAAMVDDVMFRMLEPHEVIAAMAFPDTYEVLGTKRERVRMAGNAVTPPAARDLVAAVVESLTGDDIRGLMSAALVA